MLQEYYWDIKKNIFYDSMFFLCHFKLLNRKIFFWKVSYLSIRHTLTNYENGLVHYCKDEFFMNLHVWFVIDFQETLYLNLSKLLNLNLSNGERF